MLSPYMLVTALKNLKRTLELVEDTQVLHGQVAASKRSKPATVKDVAAKLKIQTHPKGLFVTQRPLSS